MKLITFFTLVLSLNAFAAEKCRTAVAKQISQKSKLMVRPAMLLHPGEDDMYMMGEIWNDLNEPLEYYGVETSNGYYVEYTAVGASLKNCKILRKIIIGDSLE